MKQKGKLAYILKIKRRMLGNVFASTFRTKKDLGPAFFSFAIEALCWESLSWFFLKKSDPFLRKCSENSAEQTTLCV